MTIDFDMFRRAKYGIPLALLFCISAQGAGKNLWPDPGFENWQRSRYTVTNVKAEISAKDKHSGNAALRLADTDAGKSNSILFLSVNGKMLAGKTVRFSGYCKVLKASGKAQIGLSILWNAGSGWQARRVLAEPADFGGDWKYLEVKAKLPENAKQVRFILCCSNGFFQTGDALFDDISITEDSGKSAPAKTETNASQKNDPHPFLMKQSKDCARIFREFQKKQLFTQDGHTRPEIRNGTWYMNGSYEFFFGGFCSSGTSNYTRDWKYGNPDPQKIGHPAYLTLPSRKQTQILGINSYQIPVEAPLVRTALGLEQKKITQSEKFAHLYYQGMQELPLTLEYTFAKPDSYPKEKLVRIKQNFPLWHDFIPFCPEHPVGDAYYTTLFRTGATIALRDKANIYCHELFNESVYGCMCRFNRTRFAEEMRKKYRTVGKANKIWRTSFTDFDEIVSSGNLRQYPGLWADWCKFSGTRYAEILGKYANVVREVDQRKNVYFGEQTANTNFWLARGAGMDYRKIGKVMDMLIVEGGNLSFGEQAPPPAAKDGMEEIVVAKGKSALLVKAVCSAVTKGKKILANHEYYGSRREGGMRVASKRTDLPTMLWSEIMAGVSTTYVYAFSKRSWEWKNLAEAKKSALSMRYKTNNFFNPYNWPPEELAGFAMFRDELAPLKEKVLPFPRFKAPSVGFFYSYSTLRMDSVGTGEKVGAFGTKTNGWFEILKENHYPLEVVFEEEIIQGLPETMQVLVLPCAAYYDPAMIPGIRKFIARGGKVIADPNALKFDEYGNPAPADLPGIVRINAITGNGKKALLRELASVRRYITLSPELADCHAELIDRGDFKLVCLINMKDRETRMVRVQLHLPDQGEFYVSDYVNKRIFANQGRETWNFAELGKGILLPVPSQERMLLTVTKERPANCKVIAFDKTGDLYRECLRKEAPEKAKREAFYIERAEVKRAERTFSGVNPAKCFPLDLRKAATAGFSDTMPDDGKGGWFDQGKANDFRTMPLGKQTLAGVPFEIIDPKTNADKGAVILYGTNRARFPKSSGRIPVNGKAGKLYFLHTTAWGIPNGTPAYAVIVRYADGTEEKIVMRQGQELNDWQRSETPANGKIALESRNETKPVRLYAACWKNPAPAKKIASIELVSAEQGAVPAIVAVTLEEE